VSAIVSDRPAEPHAQRGGPVLFSPTYLAVDLRRIFRNRRTVIFLVIMPVLFFILFGGPYRDSNPVAFAYVMVSMAVRRDDRHDVGRASVSLALGVDLPAAADPAAPGRLRAGQAVRRCWSGSSRQSRSRHRRYAPARTCRPPPGSSGSPDLLDGLRRLGLCMAT
jgi:hypothetical protein